MVSISKVRRPRTPARRLSRLLDIFSCPDRQPRTSSRFVYAVRSTNRTGEVSVAIQNEDAEEDVVVVTSLDKLPFCCHADLILMNRGQLLIAASILNERLPAALQINTELSDSRIRNSIEYVVGLKSNPPDAPAKSTTPSRKFVPSSPISPLARHSRSQTSQLVASPSPLCDVTEEEEPEEPSVSTRYQRCKRPPLKRRGLIQEPVSPTPPRIHRRTSTLRSLGLTPARHITRSQSTQATRPLRPPSDWVLRSHSQIISAKSPTGATPHTSLASFSTPGRRIRGPQAQLSSDGISVPCPLTRSSVSDTPSPTRITRHEFTGDSSAEREVDIVMGLREMNIPPVGSDG